MIPLEQKSPRVVTQWSVEERQRLVDAVARYESDWERIAQHVGASPTHACLVCISEQ